MAGTMAGEGLQKAPDIYKAHVQAPIDAINLIKAKQAAKIDAMKMQEALITAPSRVASEQAKALQSMNLLRPAQVRSMARETAVDPTEKINKLQEIQQNLINDPDYKKMSPGEKRKRLNEEVQRWKSVQEAPVKTRMPADAPGGEPLPFELTPEGDRIQYTPGQLDLYNQASVADYARQQTRDRILLSDLEAALLKSQAQSEALLSRDLLKLKGQTGLKEAEMNQRQIEKAEEAYQKELDRLAGIKKEKLRPRGTGRGSSIDRDKKALRDEIKAFERAMARNKNALLTRSGRENLFRKVRTLRKTYPQYKQILDGFEAGYSKVLSAEDGYDKWLSGVKRLEDAKKRRKPQGSPSSKKQPSSSENYKERFNRSWAFLDKKIRSGETRGQILARISKMISEGYLDDEQSKHVYNALDFGG